MAMARREQQRTHAVDIANAVAASFGEKKRRDWDRFIKTGTLKELERFDIPITPLVQKHIDRIRANGGRFVLEDN